MQRTCAWLILSAVTLYFVLLSVRYKVVIIKAEQIKRGGKGIVLYEQRAKCPHTVYVKPSKKEFIIPLNLSCHLALKMGITVKIRNTTL